MAESQFKVEFNEQDMRRILELLDDIIDYRRAVWRGLNLGANKGKQLAVAELRSKITVRKKTISSRVKIKHKASRTHAVASFELKSAPLALSEFEHNAGKKGTSYKIWKDGQREFYEHVFKIKNSRYDKSGRGALVERNIRHSRYDGRGPLRAKVGPGLVTVFEQTPGLAKRALEKSMADAMVEIERQVQLVLDGKI